MEPRHQRYLDFDLKDRHGDLLFVRCHADGKISGAWANKGARTAFPSLWKVERAKWLADSDLSELVPLIDAAFAALKEDTT